MPVVINPRGVGSSWGTRLAIMAGRVLPPGGVERIMLGGRCEDAPRCSDDACREAGKCLTRSMLMCGTCWDAEKVSTPLIVLGPLTASVGISCGRCGGRDLEVVGFNEPTEDKRVPGRIYYSPETKQLEVWQ